MLERLFPTEFGETSKVGDDMAVLGMDATIGGLLASGTQSGVDIQLGSSLAKMRTRKKRVAAEVQSSVVPSSGMLSSSSCRIETYEPPDGIIIDVCAKRFRCCSL